MGTSPFFQKSIYYRSVGRKNLKFLASVSHNGNTYIKGCEVNLFDMFKK